MIHSAFVFFRILVRRSRRSLADGLSRSYLRSLVVITGSILLLFGIYAGTRIGFIALTGLSGIAGILAARLPGLIYLILFGMLIASSAVTFLGSFFSSRETSFLYQLPVPKRLVMAARWQEAFFMSTWAFPIIILPFHIALCQTLRSSFAYVISFPVFLFPFALLTTALGSFVASGIIALGPLWRRIRLALLLAGFAVLVYILVSGAHTQLRQFDDDPVRFLETTLSQFRFGYSPWTPPGWWYLGAEAARTGDYMVAFRFWVMLMSSALLSLWFLVAMAKSTLYRLFAGRVESDEISQRRFSGIRLESLLSFLPIQFRALLIKDLRLLIRDPGQWAQSILLFGLMGVYVFSLKGLAYDNLQIKWRLIVATANFAAVCGILTSIGTRFFFPLPSLEGKMAWLIRLAPVSPWKTISLKLILAVLWTYPPAALLSIATVVFLDLPAGFILTTGLNVFLADIALMSLSVGFGVLLPETAQEDASRIVSGIGGTLALLVGLGFVILSAIIVAFQLGVVPGPWHSYTYTYMTLLLGAVSLFVTIGMMYAASRRIERMEMVQT